MSATSPRLPSPPPFPEVQTAPKPATGITQDAIVEKSQNSRRVRPGTKASDMAKGPPLVPLSELNSPFQLQEYLKALHHKESHDDEGNSRAIDKSAAVRLATPPEGVERSLWLYELCRLLIARVNVLIVGFFNDQPKCSSTNCPEMRASEWQYLCAVHDPPKSCCAIDYCCHTLDWATNIITSQKHFPSRLTLAGDGGASQQGLRQLTNIFRRVYRMFAHAWFQHRDVFWQVEGTEGLYVFYKTVCEVYSLMPADTYTVPPEAEGPSSPEESPALQNSPPHQELPLRPKIGREGTVLNVKESNAGTAGSLTTPATTKRHKHTPSTGSFVPPITEDDEDSEAGTDRGDHSDAASVLSTVRYDPKDLQPFASHERKTSESDLEDTAEVTVLEDTHTTDPVNASDIQQKAAPEDSKSPVTPIDDDDSSPVEGHRNQVHGDDKDRPTPTDDNESMEAEEANEDTAANDVGDDVGRAIENS